MVVTQRPARCTVKSVMKAVFPPRARLCCGGTQIRVNVSSYDSILLAHSSRSNDFLDKTGPEFELQRFPMTFRPTFGGSGAAVSPGLSFCPSVCSCSLVGVCVSGRPGRYRGPQAPSFSERFLWIGAARHGGKPCVRRSEHCMPRPCVWAPQEEIDCEVWTGQRIMEFRRTSS